MKTFFISIYILFASFLGFAQKIDSVTEREIDSISTAQTEEEFLFMMEGDSTAVKAFELDEVVILKKIKFDSSLAYKKYLILRRKTRKVYPYAKMAADTLTSRVKKNEPYRRANTSKINSPPNGNYDVRFN